MMDIYTEHHPHHEIGPVEHLKYVGAQYYTTLLSRLTSHIKNEDVHVSNADKVKWEKAFLDINDLKDKVDGLTPSSDKDDIDLSDYATREWVRDQNYVINGQCPTYEDLNNLKKEIPSVADFATRGYVDDAVASIKSGSGPDMSGYATQSLILQLAQKDEFLDLKINGLQDLVNASKYTLPTASNDEKGGIKTGYAPIGNGNYPVLMSGEYAYVKIPFSTTGGDDIVVTSMYNIEVVSNTLKFIKGTQANRLNILDGSVVWKVSLVQGSSYSYVMPDAEGISTSASLLPASGVTLAYNTTREGNYVGYAQAMQVDSADYVVITVQKNGSVVARQVIPIQNPGSNGTTTVEYLSLEYPVIRLAGEYNFNTQYNDGAYNENGVYYIDIVSCEDALYKAINPGGNRGGLTQRPHPERDQGWDEYWEPFSIYGQAAFYNLLVANLAFIKSLAANQVVVVDDNGVPVAGLLSNDATITTSADTYSRNGVRIFAGETNGDITTAPFRVYDDGRVAIEKGSFTATNDDASASLDVFNERGALMPMLKLTDGFYDRSELTDEHLIIENHYNKTEITGDGITTPGLDVNGTLNIVGNLLLNGNPINNSVYTDDTQNKPQVGYYLYSDWTFSETKDSTKTVLGRCIATPETSLDGNYVWAFLSNDGAVWSNKYEDSILENRATAGDAILDTDGKGNTLKLLTVQSVPLVTIEYPAATTARNMFGGHGYLPAAGELNAYMGTIRRIFGENYGYWSSTEVSKLMAWILSIQSSFYETNKGEQAARVLAFCKTRPYPTPQDLWVDITTAQSFYTFQIKDGLLQGIFHEQTADSLAKVGDRILQLNIDNGDSAAYYKAESGQGDAW